MNASIRYLVLSETMGFFCSGRGLLLQTIEASLCRNRLLLQTIGLSTYRRFLLLQTIEASMCRSRLLSETIGDWMTKQRLRPEDLGQTKREEMMPSDTKMPSCVRLRRLPVIFSSFASIYLCAFAIQ